MLLEISSCTVPLRMGMTRASGGQKLEGLMVGLLRLSTTCLSRLSLVMQLQLAKLASHCLLGMTYHQERLCKTLALWVALLAMHVLLKFLLAAFAASLAFACLSMLLPIAFAKFVRSTPLLTSYVTLRN
jgi:hypothetical protein